MSTKKKKSDGSFFTVKRTLDKIAEARDSRKAQ
jgi:hypothetical protein